MRPLVSLRNQTRLGSSAMAFATYLNAMHNRIHPLFADRFVDSLAALPADAPLNDIRLVTRLEIVLRQDGQVAALGVVKTSGVPGFDRAALNAVRCAAPFGSAPDAIRTNDDRVYVHWEFHRDPNSSCSTMNVRPFLLALPREGGITSL